jgi:hypothetical protein
MVHGQERAGKASGCGSMGKAAASTKIWCIQGGYAKKEQPASKVPNRRDFGRVEAVLARRPRMSLSRDRG